MLKKPYLRFPKWPPLALFQKFIWFGSGILPLVIMQGKYESMKMYGNYLLPKLLGWLAPMCGGWRQWCLGQFVSGSQLARTRLSGLHTLWCHDNHIALLGWTPFSMQTWETSVALILLKYPLFLHTEFRMRQCLVLLVVVGLSLGMELGRCLKHLCYQHDDNDTDSDIGQMLINIFG